MTEQADEVGDQLARLERRVDDLALEVAALGKHLGEVASLVRAESDLSGPCAASDMLILARPRPGVVGNTKRVCHLFAVSTVQNVPTTLTALCGASFVPGELERLDGPAGMPCTTCLALSPAPPAGGEGGSGR